MRFLAVVLLQARDTGGCSLQANHLFQKFPSGSHQHVNEARFQHFSKYVWPRIADARAPGVLLFVSSYFDFVRVRNFLKAQQASFGAYCEYTHGPDVLRVRTRFAKQERRIMLYTERAHFYFRPSLRCVFLPGLSPEQGC